MKKAIPLIFFLSALLIMAFHDHISVQGGRDFIDHRVEAKICLQHNIRLDNTLEYGVVPSFRQQKIFLGDKNNPWRRVDIAPDEYTISVVPLNDAYPGAVALQGNQLYFSHPGWYPVTLTIHETPSSVWRIDSRFGKNQCRVLFNAGQREHVWQRVALERLPGLFQRLITHLHQHNLLFDHQAMAVLGDQVYKATTAIGSNRTGTRFSGNYYVCEPDRSAARPMLISYSSLMHNKYETCRSNNPRVKMARPHFQAFAGSLFSVGGTPEDAFKNHRDNYRHQVWRFQPGAGAWQRLDDLPLSGKKSEVLSLFVHQGRLTALTWKQGACCLFSFDRQTSAWKEGQTFRPVVKPGPDIHAWQGTLVWYEAIAHGVSRLPYEKTARPIGYIQQLELTALKIKTLTAALPEHPVQWEGGHPLTDKPDSFFIYVWNNRLYLFVQDEIFEYQGAAMNIPNGTGASRSFRIWRTYTKSGLKPVNSS